MNEQCAKNTRKIFTASANKPRVVFMGTSTISVGCLKALVSLPIELVMVVTKSDQLGNRQQLSIPPIKQLCLERHYPFIQPNKLSECVDVLEQLRPDFMVTCSFGKIVPERILQLFQHCINVHASLLPAYRGASPIQMAIAHHEPTTGISLMEMVKELDAGKVYWQNSISLADDETFDSLQAKFIQSFNQEFLNALWTILMDQNHGVEQEKLIKEGHQLSFAPIITKQMCFIDWTKSAREINAHVRSLFSNPLAKTRYQDLVLKIWRCSVLSFTPLEAKNWAECVPGEIVEISPNGIKVKTRDSTCCLLLEKIQLPNKNPLEVRQLINGNHCFKKHQKFF